jgi:hypothetical protein
MMVEIALCVGGRSVALSLKGMGATTESVNLPVEHAQNALRHQHVHAAQAQRSTAASRLENFSFISQFADIPDDVVCTMEYSVRAAQMGIEHKIPPITPHATSRRMQGEALITVFM